MNKLPLVSIVTPSYNQAEFLEDTIRSVLEHSYPRIEYIICDGGSTDGSVDIIREYEDHLSYWVSEGDDGQSDAINKGLSQANGQILAWLNSDDRYLPGCVSAIVDAFAEVPEAGMIYGNVEIIDEQGRVLKKRPWHPYDFADQLTQRMTIPQQAAFWRRTVMNNVGMLRTDLHYAMDFEFWIRIGRHYPIVGINQALAQYRWSSVSKGGAQGGGWGPEFLRILDALYAEPGLPSEIVALKSEAYAGAYYKGGRGFLNALSTARARTWLRKAVQLDSSYLLLPEWWQSMFKAVLGKCLYGLGRTLKARVRNSLQMTW